jgi:hypothetical protein
LAPVSIAQTAVREDFHFAQLAPPLIELAVKLYGLVAVVMPPKNAKVSSLHH